MYYGSAADERGYCPNCSRKTVLVLDHAAGDTICTGCALVLDAHYIDDKAGSPERRRRWPRPAFDKTLVDGFLGVADMADRHGLGASIRDKAKETFRKLNEATGGCLTGGGRNRNKDSVYAACLYIACRDLGMPLTYRGLTSLTAQGAGAGAAARKDIAKKMTTRIKKLLGERDGAVRASDC